MKNTKTIILVLIGLIIVVGGAFAFYSRNKTVPPTENTSATSAKEATYIIDGKPVALVNGQSVTLAAPGSATQVTTQYFGNEVTGDLNGDGRADTVFLLTQNTGGSGTFYYVVAALNTENGYVGSDGYFLGDRIAPQTTELGANGMVIVNYADRKPSDSFAVQPSEGKTVRLILDPNNMQWGVVANNFEGEADPNRMTLGMKKWNWIDTTYGNGAKVTPKVPGKFTLTFTNANTFSASTDCNGGGGEYTVSGKNIAFERMISTQMYCQGSQETDFTKMLSVAQSYQFTSKGELFFPLKDGGVMTFR